MIYSLYAGGGVLVLFLMFFVAWLLMMVIMGYLGMRLLLLDPKAVKHPSGGKIASMLDFCMVGSGIIMLGTTMSDDWYFFIINAMTIYMLLGSGMIILSWRMLEKPDSLVNSCKCTHSLKAHNISGSECSICMCKHFQGDSND